MSLISGNPLSSYTACLVREASSLIMMISLDSNHLSRQYLIAPGSIKKHSVPKETVTVMVVMFGQIAVRDAAFITAIPLLEPMLSETKWIRYFSVIKYLVKMVTSVGMYYLSTNPWSIGT